MDISSSSATDGSANLELTIPQDSNNAGIAIGSHTIHITTGSKVLGYELSLSSSSNKPESTSLLPTDTSVTTNPNSDHYAIKPTTGTLTNKAMLADNTWGYTLDTPDTNTNQPIWSAITSLNNPTTILTNTKESSSAAASSSIISNSATMADSTNAHTHTIYYGVKVDNPSITPAGEYETSVTYTATAILPPPTLTRLIINDSIPANQTSEFAIEGTNLDTVSNIKLCLRDQQQTSTTNCYEPTKINTYLDDATSTRGTVLSFTNPEIEQPGIYDLYAISPAGEVKLEQPFYVQEESICRSGDPNSDCKVDIDDNMIPIYYDGNTEDGKAIWKVASPNDPTNPGSWYDYSNKEKQWANAVTLKDQSTIDKYKDNPGAIVDNNDVLGYWVYIPRYAYEVQRPNAVDRVVADEYPLPDNTVTNRYNSHSIRNNFSIHFETDKDTKKTPADSCNLDIKEEGQMWIARPIGPNSTNESNAGPNSPNVKAKDYRTRCNVPRAYNGTTIYQVKEDNTTTWATHPAFSWLDSEGNGTELNGIWVGKFETTGTRTNPTVKPNQHANIREYIGNFYTMAKHIGIYDENNTGGNNVTGNGTTLNAQERWTSLHNLKTTTSHMLKNSEWGAVAYLASSIYGAGTNNVSINSAFPTTSTDADGSSGTSPSYGITGCGPNGLDRSINTYDDGTPLNSTTIESPTACSTTNKERSYNGEVGVLASTTNNVYGIYDMSGGAYEYVMGNLSDSPNESSTDYSSFSNPTKPPYVDLYKESPHGNFTSGLSGVNNNPISWSSATYESNWNNDVCTWNTCGGHALHETKLYQSVSDDDQSWGSDYSSFAFSRNRWFLRGGSVDSGSVAGLFDSGNISGLGIYYGGFRAVLLFFP